MKIILAVLAASLTRAAFSQTAIVSDAWISGRVLVGTNTALGRMTVFPSTSSFVVTQVSGVDLTPFLRVGQDGRVGLSTYSAAELDVNGSGDSANAGLELRSGQLYQDGSGRNQIAFGVNGTTNERHTISSVHLSSTVHNSLNFSIWTPDAGTTSVATMTVLSLVTISTASGGSVHVRPVGEPTVELVVSNGASTGGGTIHVAAQVTPSSRKIKKDIVYLTDDDLRRAYEDVKGLKPAKFRYMRLKGRAFVRDKKAPLRRGLIYEEAPAFVRGPGDSVNMDRRLLESEMAFQELAKNLESLEQEAGR